MSSDLAAFAVQWNTRLIMTLDECRRFFAEEGRFTKLLSRRKSHFRLPAIPSGAGIAEKRGYCFFPDAEAAAEVVSVSFLYSALA
jgi:hypothetical protein